MKVYIWYISLFLNIDIVYVPMLANIAEKWSFENLTNMYRYSIKWNLIEKVSSFYNLKYVYMYVQPTCIYLEKSGNIFDLVE